MDSNPAGQFLEMDSSVFNIFPRADPALPAETRLWALLQQLAGGTWGGCVYDIDRIVDTSDGVMIARGDLGVEIPPEDVPGHQKKIIQTCRRACRPVIVATQMLESMVDAPGPTRAEASDVATAIYDGADAVMLSAESATGNYPVEAVTVMDRIAVRTERPAGGCANLDEKTANGASPENTIARMAARVADELSSPAIVAYSLSGSTAWRVAAARPAQPIIVITPDLAVARRMALT